MQESMFPEQEAPMLKCSRCKEFFPATREYFYPNYKYEGWRHTCKCCLKKPVVGLKQMKQEKRCPRCKKTWPTQDFYPTSYSKDGYSSWCKECMKEKVQTHPQKHVYERRAALRRYGISIDAYDELMQKQNGVCASCGEREVHSRKNKIMSLSVDHCHVTGKVRGLLCNNCNVALGHLKDDPERIKALLKYLENHNESL